MIRQGSGRFSFFFAKMNSENPQDNLKAIQAKIAELEKKRDALQVEYDNQWFPFGSTRTQLTTVEKKLAELNQKQSTLQIVLATQQNAHEIRDELKVLTKEDDYSNSWLYSKTVRDVAGMKAPYEQWGLYFSVLGSIYGVSAHEFKRYHLFEIQKYPAKSQEWWYHVHCARVRATDADIESAVHYAKNHRFGWTFSLLLPVVWTGFVWVNNGFFKSNVKPKSISND
jgi:hypothetical protein